MADPVTAALVGSAIFGGVSTIMQGQAAAAQGKAQKKINEYNAKQAEREGKSRLEASKIEADRMARKGAVINAANRAIASKSGISISDSKSTIDVLADTAYQMHLDTNYTLNQGMQDYATMLNQGSLLRAEGAYAQAVGNKQRQTGYIMGGIQIGSALFLAQGKDKLKGNQALIKKAGGLQAVSQSRNVSNFMAPTI